MSSLFSNTCECGTTITGQNEQSLITDMKWHRRQSTIHLQWVAKQEEMERRHDHHKEMTKTVLDDGWKINEDKYGRLPYITCAILTIAVLAWAVFLGK